MYNVELAIRDYLLLKGVQTFWIDSAMGYITRGLVTNGYFADNLLTQRVRVTQGRVSSYTATFTAHVPDVQRKAALTLRYSFNAKRKVSHQVQVTAAAGANAEGAA